MARLGQAGAQSGREAAGDGAYQRRQLRAPHEQKDDFFTASTKLVNKNDLDYGAMIERAAASVSRRERREPLLLVQCSDTGLLMVLMLAYGVRVMDEKRKLWRAAEILTTCGTMHSTRARWLRRRSRNTTGTWRNATG